MDATAEIVIGLLILVGLAGILIPVLPGLILVAGVVVVWAIIVGTGVAWAVAAAAVLLTVAGTVVKFLIPGKRLKQSGVPMSTIYFAGALAIVGFFVIPIIGGPIGFVAGTYLAERRRLGPAKAGASTRGSLVAVAMSIGIELTAGLLIAGPWLAVGLLTLLNIGIAVFWT